MRGVRNNIHIIQDVEKSELIKVRIQERSFTVECLPDTFRQSQVAGKSAKTDLLINLSKSSNINICFENDNTCAHSLSWCGAEDPVTLAVQRLRHAASLPPLQKSSQF
jgi:hypothetical protein